MPRMTRVTGVTGMTGMPHYGFPGASFHMSRRP